MSVTDALMFPDRVNVLYHAAPTPDPTFDLADGTTAGPLAVPCLIGPPTPESTDLPTPAGSTALTIQFPTDHGLKPEDILAELDHAGIRTGRGFAVARYRRVGHRHLHRWQAECIARNPWGVDRP